MAGGEEGFPEVAGYDFFWLADGGEVYAGIPAEQQIDVRRYVFQLRLAESGVAPKPRFLASLGMTDLI